MGLPRTEPWTSRCHHVSQRSRGHWATMVVGLLGCGLVRFPPLLCIRITDSCFILIYYPNKGLVAALYALLVWEKTLQFIGVVGLGQVASYDDADDFKKDVKLLLTSVRAGTQAFSWAARKLESNCIGLPTSPSSSDVQNRVLQAATKHESQPSETEGIQEPESVAPVTENVDLSEA